MMIMRYLKLKAAIPSILLAGFTCVIVAIIVENTRLVKVFNQAPSYLDFMGELIFGLLSIMFYSVLVKFFSSSEGQG